MGKIEEYIEKIRAYDGPPIRLMEVCGTHTHNIFHFGIPEIFPENITLISGPGCPVCVTPAGYIDRAAELSLEKDSTLLSFGDVLRVPGNRTSLMKARAAGGSVQLMYSPMEAIGLAKREPGRMIYVAAVGFETTLPLYALLMERAVAEHVENIRLLTSVKALMPALFWICQNNPRIDGFLGPGHVSTILGLSVYEPLCREYRIPLTVGGFGFEQIVAAIYDLVTQIQAGGHQARNLYPGAVTREGNAAALALIDKYFERRSSAWRGLGEIEGSGYCLRPEYARYDAGTFDTSGEDTKGCLCGRVITGRACPKDCRHFGKTCTPENPLGPCMVSTEGTCGIWYANRK